MSEVSHDGRRTPQEYEHALSLAAAQVATFEEEELTALQRIQRFLHVYPTTVPFVVLALGLLLGVAVNPARFTTASNISTVLTQVMVTGILGIGQTLVILTAGIDLSIGVVMVISSVVMGRLAVVDGPDFLGGILGAVHLGVLQPVIPYILTPVGFLLGLACGAFFGWLNGTLVTRLKMPPFIVTLGTLTAITGGTDLLNNGTEITNIPSFVGSLGSASIFDGWLPIPVLVALGVAVVFGLILSRTRFGLRTYAIGSNEAGARRAGIRVDRHLVMVYAISGLLAGLAGLLVTANFDSASPNAGMNDELYAIASVVIGGASIFGGRGTIFGTVIGTSILAVLTTGLILTNVAPFWQQVAIGVVVVAAVAIDRVRTRVGTD